MPADLLTTRQAASRLGVSIWTIARMANDGRLTPVMRVGGSFVFNKADVDNLLAARPDPEGDAA